MAHARKRTAKIPALYKGLQSFGEADSETYFGRQDDRDRLIYNLQSSRLTVLYGARQAGKSSLLRAGITEHLRKISHERRALSNPDLGIIIFQDWKDADVLARLAEAIETEVERLAPGRSDASTSSQPGFLERCRDWTRRLGDGHGELFILFDQFEDYFLFHPCPAHDEGRFDVEFPRVVNTRGLAVNFLISIRDDLLASLDRYRGSISGLFDNLVRLDPLNEEQACEAILNPVYETYNPQQKPEEKIGIESALVSAVLEAVAIDQVAGIASNRKIDTSTGPERRFHAAGLQLVMEAVWERERSNRTHKLRLDTFLNDLGGLEGISTRFLEQKLEKYKARELNLAAMVFDNLITPGGMGIAYPLADLAKKVEVEETELQGLMERFVKDGLLAVAAQSGSSHIGCYEVSQPILTPAILDKVCDYQRRRSDEEQRLWQQIEQAKRQFAESSELDALGTIISAGEALAEGRKDLLISNDLEEEMRGTLQDILDNISEEAHSEGYRGAISSVTFCRDGKRVVGGTEDGSLVLWDLEQQAGPLSVFPGHHTSWIWALRVSRDGQYAATGCDDGSASVWEIRGASLIHREKVPLPAAVVGTLVRSLSFNTTGELLAIATTDGKVHLWNLAEKTLRSFKVSQGGVRCVEFSPDGECLATGANDGAVCLWDLEGNRQQFSVNHNDSVVWSLSFHPDGSRLASASEDHTIRLWNLQTGREESTFEGHTCWILSLRFSRKGTRLASASEDGTVRLWDLKGNELARFTHGAPVHDVSFSPSDDGHPDGRYVATASADRRLHLWDVSGKGEAFRHPKQAILMDVSFYPGLPTPGRPYLATCATDGEAQLWDREGRLQSTLRGHQAWVMCVTFSPDGSSLATGSLDGTARVWDLAGQEPVVCKGHEGPVWTVGFSPDSRLLVSGSGDGMIRLWDRKGALLRAFPGGHGPVLSVRFEAHGDVIATGSQDGTVQLWTLDGEEKLRLAEGHQGPVLSLSICPDRPFLASSSSEGTVCIWDLDTQVLKISRSLGVPVWSVAFCACPGKQEKLILASGAVDRSVRLWELLLKDDQLNDLREMAEFKGQGPIRGLAVSRDGKLATASSDGTVRLWPTERDTLEKLLARGKERFGD